MAQVTQLSIIGNVCKLVKACAIRGTKNGQWAVLTACNGGKSLLDVAFFDGAKEADARELAKLLKEKAATDEVAAARQKQAFEWIGLSPTNLRAVHANYKQDLLEDATESRAHTCRTGRREINCVRQVRAGAKLTEYAKLGHATFKKEACPCRTPYHIGSYYSFIGPLDCLILAKVSVIFVRV